MSEQIKPQFDVAKRAAQLRAMGLPEEAENLEISHSVSPMLALIESHCIAYMDSPDAGQRRMADRLLHIIRGQTKEC